MSWTRDQIQNPMFGEVTGTSNEPTTYILLKWTYHQTFFKVFIFINRPVLLSVLIKDTSLCHEWWINAETHCWLRWVTDDMKQPCPHFTDSKTQRASQKMGKRGGATRWEETYELTAAVFPWIGSTQYLAGKHLVTDNNMAHGSQHSSENYFWSQALRLLAVRKSLSLVI